MRACDRNRHWARCEGVPAGGALLPQRPPRPDVQGAEDRQSRLAAADAGVEPPRRCGCWAGPAVRARTTRHGRVSAGRPEMAVWPPSPVTWRPSDQAARRPP